MQRRPAWGRVSARGVLVLVLLAGVLGMHSLAAMGMPAAMAGMSTVTVATTADHPADHSGTPAGDHSALHECLAVLGVAAGLLALALLGVLVSSPAALLRRPAVARRPAGRAPPPRPPSLAQLCLLRV